MSAENKILLSVVVRVVGGKEFLTRCLGSLIPQTEGRPVEVIVPYDSTTSSVGGLEALFPRAVFLNMGVVQTNARPGTGLAAHEIYDRRTAHGFQVARGEILAIMEDYGVPDPDWCEQVIAAHRLPHGVIGGVVEHVGQTALNWAIYFLDFGRYQLPLQEGPAKYLTDVNISYKRAALDSVRDLWAERYNEVVVNWELARKGVVLWQRPQIVVRQDRGVLALMPAIVERFNWGRLFASVRAREMPLVTRLLYVVLSPSIPVALLIRMAVKVFAGGRNRARFIQSFPHLVVVTLCWGFGEFTGYVTA